MLRAPVTHGRNFVAVPIDAILIYIAIMSRGKYVCGEPNSEVAWWVLDGDICKALCNSRLMTVHALVFQ